MVSYLYSFKPHVGIIAALIYNNTESEHPKEILP